MKIRYYDYNSFVVSSCGKKIAIAPVYLLLAAAGLLWMLWHLLVARILWYSERKK